MTNKKILSGSRQIINISQQDEQQKLSYQTNKLSHYIELQLSDLENTLHYIQKKHSINQIKQSISHSYNIFSETEPIFRELKILFIYNKIKKLINCFSIVYLILMDHIEKPNKLVIEDRNKQTEFLQKDNQSQMISIAIKSKIQQTITEFKKPNRLGGIHLFNQQYNRHIQSDLDRLKRKLKEQKKDEKQNKISQKQKLKQEILKQINTDIYGSPSPDELTLFFNLNNNRFGSQLQYITFQDELQQIATFFKQSQDEALQFLNKSRDQFMFINFNQGFKQALTLYKTQKEGQVNVFMDKVKILFNSIKDKTLKAKAQMEIQYNQLKRLQSKINKPVSQDAEAQTTRNLQQELQNLAKMYDQLQRNYQTLKQFKQNQNQDQQKNLAALQHKIVFKDRQITILKQQLTEKSHFIDFLNEKINLGIDNRTLRKISNLYKVHNKKNSSKLKIQLQILQKQTGSNLQNIKSGIKNFGQTNKSLKSEYLDQEGQQHQQYTQEIPTRAQKHGIFQQQNLQKLKKKRKAGFSFFANDKKFTSILSRKGSFNFNSTMQNKQRQNMNDAIEQEDIMKSQDQIMNDFESIINEKINSTEKIEQNYSQSKKNLVIKEKSKNKPENRSSLQVSLKNSIKQFEPKLSSFGSKLSKNGNVSNSLHNKQLRISDVCVQEQQLFQKELNQQISDLTEDQNIQVQNQFGFNNIDQQDQQYLQSFCQIQNKFLSNRLNSHQQITSIKNESKKLRNEKTSSMAVLNNKLKINKNLSNRSNNQSRFQKQNSLKKVEKKQIDEFQQRKNNKNAKNNDQNKSFIRKDSQNNNLQKKVKVSAIPNISVQQVLKNERQEQQFKTNQIDQLKEQKIFFTKPKTSIGQQQLSQSQEVFLHQNENQVIKKTNNYQCIVSQNQSNNKIQLSTYYTNLYREEQQKSSTICKNVVDLKIVPKIQDLKNQKLKNIQKNQKRQNKHLNSQQISNRSKQFGFQHKNSTNNSNLKQPSSKFTESKNKNCKIDQKGSAELYQPEIKQNLNIQINQQRKQQEVEGDKQPIINRLVTYKQIQQTSKKSNMNSVESNKKVSSTSYDKIYGFHSIGRMVKDISWQGLSKEKMDDYLQKIAIKTALKAKNIQQFKYKIRKMHQSKCGDKCKHLERYIENFNKYKLTGRSTMKLHIQNMHETMHAHFQKQNNALPVINFGKTNLVQIGNFRK